MSESIEFKDIRPGDQVVITGIQREATVTVRGRVEVSEETARVYAGESGKNVSGAYQDVVRAAQKALGR